jgi:hypothetical protein
MALLGPSPDDLRKLHTEATQIVNQKFLLTTAAITVFGVLSAQMFSAQLLADRAVASEPRPGPPSALGWSGFLGPSLLILVLLVLFFYSTILAGMLRVITTYLVETGASSWEVDWARYRLGGHLGYTRAQAVVFLVLVMLAWCYPLAFASARGIRLGPSPAVLLHAGVSIFAVAVIASMGIFAWPDLERQPDRRWRALRSLANNRRPFRSPAGRAA